MDDVTAHLEIVEYTDSLESHSLLDELKVLRQKVLQLQADFDLAKESTSKSLFRLKRKFYTGFPDYGVYATLLVFYEKLLESDAMHQCMGWEELQEWIWGKQTWATLQAAQCMGWEELQEWIWGKQTWATLQAANVRTVFSHFSETLSWGLMLFELD